MGKYIKNTCISNQMMTPREKDSKNVGTYEDVRPEEGT